MEQTPENMSYMLMTVVHDHHDYDDENLDSDEDDEQGDLYGSRVLLSGTDPVHCGAGDVCLNTNCHS